MIGLEVIGYLVVDNQIITSGIIIISIVKNNYPNKNLILNNNFIIYTCIMKLIIYFDLPLVTSVLHNHDNKQFLYLDLQLLVTSHQFPPTDMRFYIHY